MRTYSNPITKIEASKMLVRALKAFDNYNLEEAASFFIEGSTDSQFVKEFNELMSVRIRSFAPGLVQIVHEN
jgi:hypothetical protein